MRSIRFFGEPGTGSCSITHIDMYRMTGVNEMSGVSGIREMNEVDGMKEMNDMRGITVVSGIENLQR